uniref:Uncharacterized protein n=1 Tax=Fagus sylvatica TaxID=28930 RepID=A0A2N9FL30_FAGSY
MEIVISIAAKIAEYTVAPIGQWLGYSFHYGNNIENMKNQVEELGLARDSVQHSVDTAIRNGEEIEAIVNRWLTKVDAIKGKAMEVLEDEEKAKMRSSNGACLNWKLRHQQSKKAKKIVKDIDEALKNGKFDKISFTQGIVTMRYMHYMNFESRMSTLKGLMEALRDANINMIGVWGMPGAGKTTLVTEVAKQAKEEKLFDNMAMAVVMQSPDLRQIQGEIADMLDLKFDVETVVGRASRLRERLTKDKKVLVILDDVWEKLDLEAIGIPHNGCKVVLTSRNKDMLSCEMGTQMDFGLDVLSKEEAWSLFEKMVGDSLKDPNLQSIATQVCEECAGLPIALVTVATALKNKKLFEWKDALQQLRRPSPVHLTGMQATIYSKIELSYKHLASPVVKSFFLLCGQMGFTIFYQDLLKYCFGLCLFHDISTLEEARDRVYTLVRSLKDSCLLLEDPHTSEYVRMHDLVRDVAILIAKAENVLLMRNDDPIKWPDEDARKICTAVTIRSRDIHELPDSFTQWEVEGLNNERASLAELKHLSQLTTLELHIPDAKILPKDLFFGKLQRYKIFIGDVWDWSDKHENSRTLKLKLNTSFQLGRGIKMLLNGIEDLCLDELKGVESIIYELDTEGFQQLKHLHVQNNVEIKYIIKSRGGPVIDDVVFPALEIVSLKNMNNLEEICHGQLPLTSFHNLRIVKVEHCEKLKFVFSSSIAKGLSQLQELEIRECSIMGAIVLKEEAGVEDRDMILLPQLRRLVLHRLPKLMSFLSTQKSIRNDAGEIIPECDLDFHMPILLDQVH